MFRTMQDDDGDEITVWIEGESERGIHARWSPHAKPAIVSSAWLGEAGGLAHLANTAPEGPRAYLEALAGVSHADRKLWNLIQEGRRLWALCTGIHWLDKPRTLLPSDPTEPPF